MRILVYLSLLLCLPPKGLSMVEEKNCLKLCHPLVHSTADQCSFSITKYNYTSTAVLQYIPTPIIDQTRLNITADVYYYQSNSSCHPSHIKLENVIVSPPSNESIDRDIQQLEKTILQIFTQEEIRRSSFSSKNIYQNSIELNNSKTQKSSSYRRIETVQTNTGRFFGNSIFANYLLNKLFPPTKTTCQTLINTDEGRLERIHCLSTTAGLLTIDRQIQFDRRLENHSILFTNERSNSVAPKLKTKDDFDLLLQESCTNNQLISPSSFVDLIDDDLTDILFHNTSRYSPCQWTLINRHIIDVNRVQATDYVFRQFYHDESVVEHHLNVIARNPSDEQKTILKRYFNQSCEISNLTLLRILILIADDHLTVQCLLNERNPVQYRAMAFRTLTSPMNFQDRFRTLLHNNREFAQIRILAFQAIASALTPVEINDLIESTNSSQLRFYIRSLAKQSSIWSAQSGSYIFPFGRVNAIFHEHSASLIPNILHLELANQTEIDFYSQRNSEWEVFVIFGRKSIVRFSTMNDLFQWFNNDRLFEIQTLDGFNLKINLETDLNFKWLTGYFDQFQNFFKKSTAGIALKVRHGLNAISTGYEINFNLQSNFKIHIEAHHQSTSYIWRSMQTENTLFQIEQTIHSSAPSKPNLSSTKDFCYIIPHFDSKLCLSFVFHRLWPSSIAIRLLSDDPSLVYNLTSANHFISFHIQQNEEILQSYRLQRKYHLHSWLPSSLEFSTPTTNYTSFVTWTKPSTISVNILKNHRSIANGSGLCRFDLWNGFAIHLIDVYPDHLGNISLDYNGNLSVYAPKFLGGMLRIGADRLSSWGDARLTIQAERAFFFFRQNFLLNFEYNIHRSSFNFTFTRNENREFQWTLIKDHSHLQHLLQINTSLIELDHQTQSEYNVNSSYIRFHSSSLINGWSLWNVTLLLNNIQQIEVQLNRLWFSSQLDDRTGRLELNYFHRNLLRTSFYLNQSNDMITTIDILGYHYESVGKLSTNYTNFILDFPIVDHRKKKSHMHLEFSSFDRTLLFKVTSRFHNGYSFTSVHNVTFDNRYLSQLNLQSSLKILHHSIVSLHSVMDYLPNSTNLQFWNGSLLVPVLFFSKPFLFTYRRDAQLFIQFAEWMNVTRVSSTYHLSTIFGLRVMMVNNLPTKISFRLEQPFLDHRFLLLFEIEQNWMTSLIVNQKTRYEFLSAPLDSAFFLKRIDLNSNHTRLLPINYHTDNQTLIRIEILFSKYFSRLINDFLLDISLKNHTLKLLCHIPFFRREFFVLTWDRYLHEELFHFHGLIQTKFLRRRRLFDYEYNYNLASIRFWTWHSRLLLLSFDPIQWNCNFTNDYLWNGRWALDYGLKLGHRRELIRLHHQYQYTTALSNLVFHLHLINTNYNLDFNYYHTNSSIQGQFLKNKDKHDIEGYWNTTESRLQLNTQQMKSITTIKATLFKSIIDIDQRKIGLLLEQASRQFTNDTEIFECNPYLIVQRLPRLFIVHYYTLNDGLSSMMLEWSARSYLSWNYTGNGRPIFPLTKFEIDIRTRYIIRLHTSTFKYSSIYNNQKHQFTIRREPLTEDADDRLFFRARCHTNRTFLIHLQVLNNHYEILGQPANEEDSHWQLQGYFVKDPFNGSVLLSNTDWWVSSKLNFNSSFYIQTGRYVQLVPTFDPQIALEIRHKSQLHFAVQYASIRSLIAWKFLYESWNINLWFFSKPINEKVFRIHFQFNALINQSWTLEIDAQRFSFYNDQSEFIFNGSLEEFSFRHLLENKSNAFLINADTLAFHSNTFGVILSNRSSETTRTVHVYHSPSEQNLTINYYGTGRFSRDGLNIQTPIYDINAIYYPSKEDDRYVKVLFEFLPLQMSSFSFVRGRSFRIGYQTHRKQLILAGNLAFGLEDIDDRERFFMNERWKLIYGNEPRERLYLKWNIKINARNKSLQGRMSIQDPNDQISVPISTDINVYVKDTIFIGNIQTVYSSSENSSKPIILELNVDPRLRTQQSISLRLIHQPSKTNLSLTVDHHPQRKLHILLQPNNHSIAKTFLHLYANSTESQLNIIVILAHFINWNLTLPKSYPETGLLHSALFLDHEEYFDGRLDTSTLRLRTPDYLLNLSLAQLVLEERLSRKVLASIVAQWIDRNSSTALISIFSERSFLRKTIPVWQSAKQQTWLMRFKQFLFDNDLTSEFLGDIHQCFSSLQTDFVHEQGEFGVQINDHLELDEDLKSILQQMTDVTAVGAHTVFQIGLLSEGLFQEYLNNLTCLNDHQNLIHLNISQLTLLTIDTFVYELISRVNRTFIMLNHFTHYPRSLNAMVAYLSNEVILKTYGFVNTFYLETKQFSLTKAIQFSHEVEFLLKISPLLSESISLLSSKHIRTVIYVTNERVRHWLTIWKNSPLEHKLMKTMARQSIELTDKLRFYLDDKLDFLLPTIQKYTPRGNNPTFLLTWARQHNFTAITPEE